MTTPVPGSPGWHPDPSGRHQLRWFDGGAFSDQVADEGVVTTDAGPLTPPSHPTPQPAAGGGGRKRAVPVVLAVVGLLAVAGAAAYLLLGRDDGGSSGTGTFEATIEDDVVAVAHDVTLAAGDVLTVEVEPDDDLDVVVAAVVSEETAEALDDLFDDLGGLEALDLDDDGFAVDLAEIEGVDPDGVAVLRTDVGFPGEEEQVLLTAPFEVEASIVVIPFDAEDSGEGSYDATVEAFDLEVDDEEEADLQELLEAVGDDDEVPDDFRDLADELLASAD